MANDEPIVTPRGWLSRGEAFVPGEGQQLAVFGGIPGEKVKVRIEERAGHQVRGRALHPVGKPSPDRVEPRCDRFLLCGHCSLMHLADAAQDRMRHAQLAEAFAATGVEPAGIVRGASWEFSHQLELVTGWSEQRRPRLGVRQRVGRRVIAIPECPLFTPGLRELMKVAAHWMIELEVYPWEGGRGSLRGILARQSRATGEILVTLVYGRPTPFAAAYAERVAGGLQEVRGVFAHWNDDPSQLVAEGPEGVPEATLVYGRGWIEDEVDGNRVRLGPFARWPEHAEMAARMTTDLVDALAPAEGDAVLDLDAGIGARTLALARRSGWALGTVATEPEARAARENATLNGVPAEFVMGTPAEVIDESRARLEGRRPLVVAELGRRGLAEADVAAIAGLSPRRVALIGANARAVAKDAGRIAAAGFRLDRVVPYDLRPHTPFVETLALLASLDERPPEKRAPRRKRV